MNPSQFLIHSLFSIDTEDYGYLRHLDSFGEESQFQPDILVGADCHWDLMAGKKFMATRVQ